MVLLNKSKREDCQVTVNVNGVFEDGSLLWMMPEEAEGPDRMAAKVSVQPSSSVTYAEEGNHMRPSRPQCGYCQESCCLRVSALYHGTTWLLNKEGMWPSHTRDPHYQVTSAVVGCTSELIALTL